MKTTTKLIPLLIFSLILLLPSATYAGAYDYCAPIITPNISYYPDGTGHEIEFVISQMDDFCIDGISSGFVHGQQKQTFYPLQGVTLPETVPGVFSNAFPFPTYSVTVDVTDDFLEGYHWYRAWVKMSYGDSPEVTVFTPWIEGTDQVTRTDIGEDIPDDYKPPTWDEPPYAELNLQDGTFRNLQQLQQRR